MIKRVCQNCGKEFLTFPFRVKEGNAKYCSQGCFHLNLWKHPTEKMLKHIKMSQKLAAKKRIGMKHSDTSKKKISENRKGKCLGNKNPKYKGGYIDNSGYLRICINGKQIKRAKHILERKLGRKLSRFEDTHHIDGNKLNDNSNNLIALSKSEHTKLHFTQNPIKFRERYIK